jgi:hypothetical protein
MHPGRNGEPELPESVSIRKRRLNGDVILAGKRSDIRSSPKRTCRHERRRREPTKPPEAKRVVSTREKPLSGRSPTSGSITGFSVYGVVRRRLEYTFSRGPSARCQASSAERDPWMMMGDCLPYSRPRRETVSPFAATSGTIGKRRLVSTRKPPLSTILPTVTERIR